VARHTGRPGHVIDILATYDRTTAAAVQGGGRVDIERFPPAAVLELADSAAGDMVYVAHLKVDNGDWGMLALVGPVQAELAEGRETMNQWAACSASLWSMNRCCTRCASRRRCCAGPRSTTT
jgi:hypothetical protein